MRLGNGSCLRAVTLILPSVLRLVGTTFLLSVFCLPLFAQGPDPQIELNLMTLPTTQSLRPKQSYFRLTHRFNRDLTLGKFSDLAKDLFAFDNGALLGLEYRIGVAPGIHAGLHRSTLHKTLQVFGRWDAVQQGEDSPFGISALGTFEGLDNLQDGYQPGVGAVLSKTFGRAVALYASPIYVWGTFDAEQVAAELGEEDHGHDHLVPEPHDPEDDEHGEHEGEGTFFFGLGARIRVRPSVFVVGEFSPRVSGHDPGDEMWAVGIEKSTRGHTLALTLTNSYATTPGQIARGGTPGALYLGFNITRKF